VFQKERSCILFLQLFIVVAVVSILTPLALYGGVGDCSYGGTETVCSCEGGVSSLTLRNDGEVDEVEILGDCRIHT
jgi:hypothetical protein